MINFSLKVVSDSPWKVKLISSVMPMIFSGSPWADSPCCWYGFSSIPNVLKKLYSMALPTRLPESIRHFPLFPLGLNVTCWYDLPLSCPPWKYAMISFSLITGLLKLLSPLPISDWYSPSFSFPMFLAPPPSFPSSGVELPKNPLLLWSYLCFPFQLPSPPPLTHNCSYFGCCCSW